MHPFDLDVVPKTGYDPQIGLLLASLEDSTREWRDELGTPTVEAIGWQLRPQGPSIGSLILHMIDAEVWWLEIRAARQPERPEELESLMSKATDQDGGIWPTPPREPIEWYFDLQDRLRARSFEAIRNLKGTDPALPGHHNVSVRWILAHLVQHDAYHGGQAVMLHETFKRI